MFSAKEQRVTVTHDIDLEPWTTLKKGESGTVVSLDKDDWGIVSADIRLDKKHAGLNRWNNEAHIEGPELSALAFSERNRPRAVTVCLSTMVAAFSGILVSGAAFAEAIDVSWHEAAEALFRALFTG